MTGTKPADCFTAETDIANDFFDFDQVLSSLEGSANTIDENEIAFKMRLDERAIPVSPELDYSYFVASIQAEVYYKGNRHPTRRLLQEGPGDIRGQTHVMETAFTINHQIDLKANRCVVDSNQMEGSLRLQLTYTDPKKVPVVENSSTWASTFGHQIEAALGARRQVSVTRVQVGNDAIFQKGNRSTRRMENGDMSVNVAVELKVTSNDQKAGVLLNLLQDMLMDPDSNIHKDVNVFESHARITKMDVVGCGQDIQDVNMMLGGGDDLAPRGDNRLQGLAPREEDRLQSSAASVSMIGLLLASFALAW